MKDPGSTREMRLILPGLRTGEETGIPGVAVKCVDTGRITGGESDSLDDN